MARRLALALLLACAASAAAAGGAQAVPNVTVECSPAPDDCSGWYRSVPVKVQFSPTGWDTTSGCDGRSVTSDTKGVTFVCSATGAGQTVSRGVTIHVDMTPPAVFGVASRPADFGSWFNQPLGVAFRGTDATSGVASCSTGGYGGPDTSFARVGGTCRDVAGNVGSGSFAFAYDATAPKAPAVEVMPGNRRVTLSWSRLRRNEVAEVSRARGGPASASLYSGTSRRLVDRGLRNGRRYRYTVAVRDQAGNRAASDVVVVPTASRLLLPARGVTLKAAPRLVWKRVRRADYYNVQLYRGGRKLMTRWPRRPRLPLRRLRPGKYRWYVWAGYGRKAARRYGSLLGTSTFRIR
jgi:hypothetical protein